MSMMKNAVVNYEADGDDGNDDECDGENGADGDGDNDGPGL